MEDLFAEETPQPKKRGRPVGSNKQRAMLKKFEEIYEKIEGTLNDEQRDYYQKVFSGRAPFDPIKMSEIFMLHFSMLSAILIDKAIEDGKITQDTAQTIAQYRMGLKDSHDMKRREFESEEKKKTDGRVIDPTRQSSESRIADLIERATESQKK